MFILIKNPKSNAGSRKEVKYMLGWLFGNFDS